MSSTDFELDDNYADDDVNFDESSSKILSIRRNYEEGDPLFKILMSPQVKLVRKNH